MTSTAFLGRLGIKFCVSYIALAPFANGWFCGPVTLGKNPGRFITGLYRRPDLRCRRRLAVKLDQHVALPLRISVEIQRAMKSADRPGDI